MAIGIQVGRLKTFELNIVCKVKYTPAVRSNILSKLIYEFASYVLRDHVLRTVNIPYDRTHFTAGGLFWGTLSSVAARCQWLP